MDTVHLIGAEDIRSASRTIAAAADDMRQASNNFEGTMERAGGALQEAARSAERAGELMVRAALATIEVEAMKAHNAHCAALGSPHRHSVGDFLRVLERLRMECGL